jgi:hypothetical protein
MKMALSDGSKPAQFSNVVLTIVSIIIALWIEHLLGHVTAQIAEADGIAEAPDSDRHTLRDWFGLVRCFDAQRSQDRVR